MNTTTTVRLSDFEHIANAIASYVSGVPPLETAVVVEAIRQGKIPLPPRVGSGVEKTSPSAEDATLIAYSELAQRYRALLPEDSNEATKRVRLDAGRFLRIKDIDAADKKSAELRAKAAQLVREADTHDAEVASRLRRLEHAERDISRIETALETLRARDLDAEEQAAEEHIENLLCKAPLDRTAAEHHDLAYSLGLLTELPHLRRITSRAITRLEGELKEAASSLGLLRGTSKATAKQPVESTADPLAGDFHN